jgi:O-antigen chain-terminating methyltransferase
MHDRLTADTVAMRSQVDVLDGEFRVIRDESNRTGEHLRNLQGQVDRTVAEFQQPRHLEDAVARLEQRLTDDGSYLKGELSRQRSVVAQLLARNGSRASARKGKKYQPAPGTLDTFYVSFEDRFRGPREEIKRRLEFYLRFVIECGAGTADRPVLDVGCGRGEWLELLKERELVGRGVDLNATMSAHCAERGLEISHADALEHLRDQADSSFGAVTGFHIIEHLPLETLLDLFAETQRVLAPGGVAIFESPNCKNLVVGACNFNIDPTHRNPVFPETAEFMLGIHGFEKVEINYLSPVQGSPFKGRSADSKFLNELLFGPQDFSVIAYKSAAA